MPNEPVAYSDVGTQLYVKSGNAYAVLVGIVDVPDSGNAGGTIEVTELQSPVRQNIADRPENPDQDFTFNRTATKYAAVKAVCDGNVHEFLVVFSDGEGTYIRGSAQCWKNGFEAGSAQQATLHIVAEDIQDKTASEVTALLGG